jgi:hypothetical protein
MVRFVLLVSACLLSAHAASAAEPARYGLALEYVAEGQPDACPGAVKLREEVRRRVGYDPFGAVSGASPMGTFQVVLSRSSAADAADGAARSSRVRTTAGRWTGFVATYGHVGRDGVVRWTRSYAVSGTSRRACDEAVEGVAVELAAEMAVWEPDVPAAVRPVESPASREPSGPAGGRAPGAATDEPVPPSASSSPAPSSGRSGPRSPTRPRVDVGAGVRVAGGVTPGVAVGAVARVGVEVPAGPIRVGVAAEAVADEMTTVAMGPYAVQVGVVAGGLSVCAHVGLPGGRPGTFTWGGLGCVVGLVGVVRQDSAVAPWLAASNLLYAGVGPRGGFEARVLDRLALGLAGDVLPTVAGVRVTVAQRDLFRSGVVGVSSTAWASWIF